MIPEQLAQDALPVLILALCVLLVIGVVLVWVVLSRLRLRHAATWEDLGSPQLAPWAPTKPVLNFYRFLWRKRDAELGDSRFSALCSLLRWFFVVYVAIFIGTFALQVVAVT